MCSCSSVLPKGQCFCWLEVPRRTHWMKRDNINDPLVSPVSCSLTAWWELKLLGIYYWQKVSFCKCLALRAHASSFHGCFFLQPVDRRAASWDLGSSWVWAAGSARLPSEVVASSKDILMMSRDTRPVLHSSLSVSSPTSSEVSSLLLTVYLLLLIYSTGSCRVWVRNGFRAAKFCYFLHL